VSLLRRLPCVPQRIPRPRQIISSKYVLTMSGLEAPVTPRDVSDSGRVISRDIPSPEGLRIG
jgi:hypothetical protein